MSRTSSTSTRNKVKSPVKYWFNFKGNSGTFTYWNGTENVELDKLEVVLLDTKASVTGWSDSAQAKVWSNYVSTTKEPFTVLVGNKKELEGLYADLKKEIEDIGGHFTQNLFVLVDLGEGLEIGCIQLSKSSLGAYSEFTKDKKRSELYNSTLVLTKGKQDKKGSVKYFVPEFSLGELSEDVAAVADVKDLQLQAYFNPEQEKEESDSAY